MSLPKSSSFKYNIDQKKLQCFTTMLSLNVKYASHSIQTLFASMYNVKFNVTLGDAMILRDVNESKQLLVLDKCSITEPLPLVSVFWAIMGLLLQLSLFVHQIYIVYSLSTDKVLRKKNNGAYSSLKAVYIVKRYTNHTKIKKLCYSM